MAAISTAVIARSLLAGTAYSIYSGQQQMKMAKKQQRAEREQQAQQQRQIAEEQANAQKERQGLLAAQRYQMGYDNTYSTSGTSSVGRSLTTGESTLG